MPHTSRDEAPNASIQAEFSRSTAHEALNTARGGCVFCTYELEHTAQIRTVPVATQVVQTRRGPRDLCDAHAERDTWSTAETLPAPPEAP